MDLFISTILLATLLKVKKSSALNQEDKLEKSKLNNGKSASAVKKGSFLLKGDEANTERSLAVNAYLHQLRKKSTSTTGSCSSLNETVGRKLIATREKDMGPNVSIFYKQDGGLVITSGNGVFMHDIDGNDHLDCCNNVACVGHSHPDVVAAGCKEMANIQTNGRFLNPTQQRYLEKLLATFPPELNTVYMVNSGSEANDLALRIARAHAKVQGQCNRPEDVIILDSAYHGHTQALVDISPYKWYQATDGWNYHPPTTHVVSCPDGYRGRVQLGQTEECGRLYAEEVEQVVRQTGGVGVFIAESIVGCGGQIVPPPGYLRRCYAAVRQRGGVCIADEVQTGFARCGTHFWMFQQHGVVPDIVSMGKPMGNGYPVAAVVVRREVAQSFAASGIEYFNTYGGNSVACAIAEAVLDTIKKEKLQENALQVGLYLTQQLNDQVKSKYPKWVGDVRGNGLFQGVEIVQNGSKALIEPYPELTKFLVDHLRYDRIIVSRDGPDENVIKIKPPLVFSKSNVDLLVSGLLTALDAANSLGVF